MSGRIIVGDCVEVMASLDADSFGAVVCDPPYHLTAVSRGGSPRLNDPATPFGRTRLGGDRGFMGKSWDGGDVAFRVETWTAALRVTRPGGYLLAFGGTRTFHRLACAIEDAGWEIHDCLSWLYGSGFPKHASKLKPAWEPIILARRPAKRATRLNIDECRIGTGEDRTSGGNPSRADFSRGWYMSATERACGGRWPANVVLDEEAGAMLDEQSGILTSGFMPAGTEREGIGYHGGLGPLVRHDTHGDRGGASRFFYCAKASRAEREAGLAHLVKRPGGSNAKGFTDDVARGLDRNRPVANHHPTVKPIELMRWLVRLVALAGLPILDPFAGSGTTLCAAALEGIDSVGIEQDEDHAAIARARVAHWSQQTVMQLPLADGAA